MPLKPRTIGLITAGILVFGGLAFVSFRTEPVPVDLHEIETGQLTVTIDADGRTRIRDIYEVAAPISGTALRAPVRVGDRVVEGETVVAVVAPVEPVLLDARSRAQAEASVREADAALHVAETDLTKAREDRAHAQSQFERVETLVSRGVATITQLEDASQRLAIADAALEAAEARLDMARGTLARAEATLSAPESQNGTSAEVLIRAPSDGVVLELPIVSERPVTAGTVLLSIGDPENLEIVADLLSTDAVRIAPGARAIVDRWGGPGTLEAELLRIDPAARTKISALGIEEQRVDAIFAITSPPEARKGLGDGFSVYLRIVEWEATDVVKVPLSALFRRGEAWAVFVYSDGVARERPVEIGRRSTDMAQIIDGIEPGERVITHPSDEIVDGIRVVDREEL